MNKLSVTIDDARYDVAITPSRGASDTFVVIVNGQEMTVRVPDPNDTSNIDWMIVDGRPYEVVCGADLHYIQIAHDRHFIHVRDVEAHVTRTTAGDGRVKAPIPGQVTRVRVEVGQTVLPGESVLVLEAMKMENEIRAPKGGVVRSINVKAGQNVTLNETLLEIE
ncbi:MAG: acetyl-CoA carboxylase biotin carboxyl carrier protein subunit [Caldilineaceae bacterium]|nr:acetyl-CoA carboxylase biotin carboxyl carrier protein subunit [Caldilineaceae bacterium]